MEIWNRIEDSKYYISNLGNVKNKKTDRVLKQFVTNVDGYKASKIRLKIVDKRRTYIISRLVAINFISNPDNKSQVDHIDRDSLNNNVTNLRWVTQFENSKNRLMLPKGVVGEIINLYKKGNSIKEIEKYLAE